MPTITILQGPRPAELKRELVARITDSFVDTLGVPPESVQVCDQGDAARELGSGRRPDRGQVTAQLRLPDHEETVPARAPR